jgi:hypothetical protein
LFHETVTHGSSKAIQLFALKLRRFWHHCELCSRVKKWSNRDDRQTNRQTDRVSKVGQDIRSKQDQPIVFHWLKATTELGALPRNYKLFSSLNFCNYTAHFSIENYFLIAESKFRLLSDSLNMHFVLWKLLNHFLSGVFSNNTVFTCNHVILFKFYYDRKALGSELRLWSAFNLFIFEARKGALERKQKGRKMIWWWIKKKLYCHLNR